MARERKIQEVFAELRKDGDIAATLDSYAPLARLVLEVIEERVAQGITQEDLAHRLGTKQSAISRFENLGRKPGFAFLQSIAQVLGGKLFVTIHGRYAALVPRQYRKFIDQLAAEERVEQERVVQRLLREAIEKKVRLRSVILPSHPAAKVSPEIERIPEAWQEKEVLAS